MSGEMHPQTSGTVEPGSIRLVGSLAVAGFLAGIIIISVYLATLPTITANKARELREAVFKVLPGVTQMQPLHLEGEALVAGKGDEETTIFGGYDQEGKFIGYAIPNGGPGFQDTIRLLYGYLHTEKKVVGMEILESRETPGLGDKIFKDLVFVANFDNLSVEPEIVTVKKGTKSRPNEVDAITGATISSKAVVRIINEANVRWLKLLPRPGAEPKLAQTEEAER